MVMAVLWGFISSQLLQKIAMLFLEDMKLMQEGKLDVRSIEKLSQMGSKGSFKSLSLLIF